MAREAGTSSVVDVLPLDLRADIRAESVDEEARTVEVVFSTGAPVERYDWLRDVKYVETLSLKPEHVRLKRLNTGAPFLDTHSGFSLSSILGVVVEGSAKVTGGRGVATVRFSRRDDVEPIWQDVRDGIVRNVSVGYRVHRYEQSGGGDDGKPVKRHAVDWEPYEISAVPLGADADAHIRRSDPNVPKNQCVIVTRSAQQREPAMEREQEPVATTTPPPTAPHPEVRTDVLDPGAPRPQATALPPQNTDRDRGQTSERERVHGIMHAVRCANRSMDFAEVLIKEGVSIEEAQRRILDDLSKVSRDNEGPRSVQIWPQPDNRDANEAVWRGIENALLHRIAPGMFKLDDLGRNYRGLSLIETAKICLQARGVRTTGMSKMDVAGQALGLGYRAGLHTTSDFATILADVANKTLRRAYEEAPQTFQQISRRTTLPDFKPVRRNQLGEAPPLLKVNEHGEFTRGTIGEGKEQYQLATYGRVFGITRIALVNDDTDAFSRITQLFGRSARHLESDLVWEQITSNPTMGDGVALFHATHGNLAGAGAVISVTTVGAGRAAMRKQKGLDATQRLNIMPRFLAVPVAIETVADQFVSTALMASQTSNVNPFGGKLGVIAEPRLDDNSATAWYLIADAGQIDIIEYAYLEGEEGPVVETRVGFDVDGLEVKCRHDFAAKVIDWRGVYKNPGA